MRAVFLDRDGVINEEVDLLHRIDQLRLLPGAAEGIRLLNNAGLKVIIVTNQPVVARGLCTEKDIDTIHDKLRQLLAYEQARIDAVYFCPHHENANLAEYRMVCPDRKPGPGMLQRAAQDFSLDLSECYMVGDRTVDIQAGKDAGCRTILVTTGYAGRDGKHDVTADAVCNDLKHAAEIIVAKELTIAQA
jgi:histidinol-phosphate phosphatase family protein